MTPEMQTTLSYAAKGNTALRQVLEHLFERVEGAAPDAPAAEDADKVDRKIKALAAKVSRRDATIKAQGKEIDALKAEVAAMKTPTRGKKE